MNPLNPITSLEYFEKNPPEFIADEIDLKIFAENLRNALGDRSENFHASLLTAGQSFIKFIIAHGIEFLSIEGGSPKEKSIKAINRYIDAFVVFEEMLFGLNPSYRDHTLHSLWVYLFGHQWINSLGGYDKIKIAGQLNITFTTEGQPKFILAAPPVQGSKKHLEAMWGMIAILHDLGYPVEAISNKPGEIFGKILEPFAIDFSSHFHLDLSSRVSLLYDSICDLLSSMYRPLQLKDKEETDKMLKEVQEKAPEHQNCLFTLMREPTVSKAEAMENEFRIASVDKIHSAWSAIFSFKNITYLHESDYHGGGTRDYLKLLTRRDILYSIVHHTSEEPKDLAVNRFQFLLLLIDDIEEAVRYSRGGKERGLVSDYCSLGWELDSKVVQIQLDYRGYNFSGEKKYNELFKKYKAQILPNGTGQNYEIEMNFVDDNFNKTLRLFLVMD